MRRYSLLSAFTSNPKIEIFGIGLAITFVVGVAIGLLSPQQVFAPFKGF